MKAPKGSTIAICVAVFFTCLLFAFPFQNLKGFVFGKIHKATGILIVAEEMYPSFFGWPGIGIKKVNISLPVGDEEMEFASDKLFFRVGLSGLFPPAPAISLKMINLKKGGDLFLKLSQPSGGMWAYIDASQVNLEQIQIPGLQERMLGSLDAEADLTINTSDLSKANGYVHLGGQRLMTPNYMVEIPGMPFLIPGMLIDTLEIKTNIKNGVVELQTFKFGKPESDLSGSLAGDIRLGKDYLRTFLNLTLRLTISRRILENPQNTTFLNFLSGYQTSTPGSYAMKWSASIQEMMGSIKALPEAVK